MKTLSKFLSVLIAIMMISGLAACKNAETSSTNSSSDNGNSSLYKYKNVVPPEISSDDRVMSVFFDISYYNVENYAEIYLGKKFKIVAEFDGIEISAPSDFKTLTDKGFTVAEGTFEGDSIIYAGDKQVITFKSPGGHLLSAEFYNGSAKSKKISECSLVKYSSQSDPDDADSINEYLSVNGISALSSLSEVITKLGYPSHFHKENNDLYSLDYFLDKNDLRNRITIFANPEEDVITSVSFCDYTK